jgi:hypothetical protein
LSLLAEAAAVTSRPGPRCSVAKVREALSVVDAAELNVLLADPNTNLSAVARVLTKRGHRMIGQTLARHARGDCLCGRA